MKFEILRIFKLWFTSVLVDGLGELLDGTWDLQSLHEDSLLSLEKDVLGPSHKSGEISSWEDISTDSEIFWSGLEEWIGLSDFLGFRFSSVSVLLSLD